MTGPFAQRYLLGQLVRRDLASRYRGSLFGLLWMLLTPLLMLGVYSFVFSLVFDARWGGRPEADDIPFALLLFSGLILHGVLAEILPRSVTLIRQHPSYVKKVVFPIELLSASCVISACSLFAIQAVLLLAACLLLGIAPSWHWLWLPIIWLPFLLLLLGLSWWIAALGVFLPDLTHVMGLLVTVLLFMSPIFYPLERLPEAWQTLLWLNPLSIIVTATRDALFFAEAPAALPLALFTLAALAMVLSGYGLFKKCQPVFADIL